MGTHIDEERIRKKKRNMDWLKQHQNAPGPYFSSFEDEIVPTECPPPEELDKATKWAGAFLGATLVTSCALGSICLIPCRHSRFYLLLSNCLVALAISTASGAAFFQLAPSALGLDDDEMAKPFVIVPACVLFFGIVSPLTKSRRVANGAMMPLLSKPLRRS